MRLFRKSDCPPIFIGGHLDYAAWSERFQQLYDRQKDKQFMQASGAFQETPPPDHTSAPGIGQAQPSRHFQEKRELARPETIAFGQIWATRFTTPANHEPPRSQPVVPRIVIILGERIVGKSSLLAAPISLETSLGSLYDFQVSQGESPLRYRFMIEVWNQTPMLKDQLGRYLGMLDSPLKSALMQLYQAFLGQRPYPRALAGRLGPAIQKVTDPVALFQEAELAECDYLRRPLFARLEEQTTAASGEEPASEEEPPPHRRNIARWLEAFYYQVYQYLVLERFASSKDRAHPSARPPDGYDLFLRRLRKHVLAGTSFQENPPGQRRGFIENIQYIAYLKALLLCSPLESAPEDYARLQSALGAALCQRAIAEGVAQGDLEEAIACYREALLIYTPEKFPVEYARVQSGLGLAYLENSQMEQALAAFNAAAAVSQRSAVPANSEAAAALAVAGTASISQERPFLDYITCDFEVRPDKRSSYTLSYKVVVKTPLGEAREVVFFVPGELAMMQAPLDTRNRLHSLAREEQTFLSLGQALFKQFFTGTVHSLYKECLQYVWQRGKGLRLRVNAEAAELANLPWEHLYDARQENYLSLSRMFSLVRAVAPPLALQPLPVVSPLRVLLMMVAFGNQRALERHRVQQRLLDALEPLSRKGLLSITWVEGQTREHLEETLEQQGPWHIFHFIGQATFAQDGGEEAIMTEDETGQAQPLPASGLGERLREHGLQLAMFNLHREGAAPAGGELSSAAATLSRQGIPAVLSIQMAITEEPILEGIAAFYQEIAQGASVDEALASMRATIHQATPDPQAWGKPMLYLRASQGNLFHLIEADQKDRHSPPTRHGFQRRKHPDRS